MDFELTREQKMIIKNVREFMRKEIEPVAEEIDREDRFPEGIGARLATSAFSG